MIVIAQIDSFSSQTKNSSNYALILLSVYDKHEYKK